MEPIKRLITVFIPLQKCNLKCEYCYISQLDAWKAAPEQSNYSAEHIARCFSRERLGGTCLINFTGDGETLLQTDLPEIVEGVLREGHFVEVVTNGIVTKQLRRMLEIDPAILPQLEFKLSFHYKELKDKNLLEQFFDNVQSIRKAGASFTLELMAYDAIEEDIDNIKQICLEKAGACCHATIGRDESTTERTLLTQHSKEEFQDIWRPLESTMMEIKFDLLDVKRREFCYAGCWSLYVNMYTGESQSCYWIPSNQNIFEDPDKPIKFLPVGYACPQPFCINGHAHLTLGMIPELEMPTYNDIRNRQCSDGGEWFSPEGRDFYSTRLYEANEEYTQLQKILYTIKEPFYLAAWLLRDRKTKTRIKNYLNRYVKKKD